jgi:hypothetical protein
MDQKIKAIEQKRSTIYEIRFHINRAHKAKDETVKERKEFIVIGMLSLAKSLEIITSEEYEELYKELFNN